MEFIRSEEINTSESAMLKTSFYEFKQLNPKNHRKLHYTDTVFVNGRYYRNYERDTDGQTFWLIDEDYTTPQYFIPLLPHIISNNPAALFAEFRRLENYFSIYDQITITQKLSGLTIHDGAYPRGGFANQAEYERYINLYVGNRTHEIAGYLAGLAGAPAFNARDPYQHGHCYLLLLPHDRQLQHYREGQDVLTKSILERIWPNINRERIICFELRAADAHLTLDKRPGANQILIKCGDLADKLRDAFEDGICDHEELTDIYFATPQINRT